MTIQAFRFEALLASPVSIISRQNAGAYQTSAIEAFIAPVVFVTSWQPLIANETLFIADA